MATFGLRGKSLLALLLACLLALVPAALVGWMALQSIHEYFGDAYARNATLLNREKIRAPISRELALSLRLADSEVTRQWLLDEQDEAKSELFFMEAEGYRKDFRDHAYFIGSVASQGYYFNSDDEPLNPSPRYILDEAKPADNWFFSTLRDTDVYNINVDFNPTLNTTGLVQYPGQGPGWRHHRPGRIGAGPLGFRQGLYRQRQPGRQPDDLRSERRDPGAPERRADCPELGGLRQHRDAVQPVRIARR
jgi:hypothetical protein